LNEFVLSLAAADLAACDGAGSFLQSAQWGRFKSRFGWQARAFLVEWAGGGARPMLALFRGVAPGVCMAYVPWGPELPDGFHADEGRRGKALAELARALRPHLPRNTTFVRFDPPWFLPSESAAAELPAPFRRAAADIQPPDTVIVDLAPDAQDILASMKTKWRYNVGLAERRGVSVRAEQDVERGLDVFYGLLAETAARDGIAIHSAGYYRALFEEFGRADGARACLYTAWHEGDCLAGLVALFRGEEATYLYGASSNAKRNFMAPYALQWRAMQDAKAAGCARYDLFGIPPSEDPAHPMAGLYRFKTGFGGRVLRRPGSWDYPCRPLLYALFSAAESLRKKLRDRRKTRGGKS